MKSRLLLVLQDVEVNLCHNFSSLLLQSQPSCRLCIDLNETVEWIEPLARAVWCFPVQEIDVFRKSRINAMIISMMVHSFGIQFQEELGEVHPLILLKKKSLPALTFEKTKVQ